MKSGAGYPLPERRPLQIFAFDPMVGRTIRNRLVLEVRNEPLLPGPQGSRVQVIDYDGTTRALYQPVDLDDPALLMNGGLDPLESDPRFHQQMVYAVAMKVLENFEEALGRSLAFKDRRPLRIFPHAFEGANAYYDPKQVAVLFGYFRADEDDPGPNLPGQTVFTCLSHDVVAHEVTHAMVDRLRPLFIEETNQDVFAFHEAFSDIVAIFQHFSFRSILAQTIQQYRSDLRARSPLVSLAVQFGFATGSGGALRGALEPDKPDAQLYKTVFEPHERGSILVAAVFDAFFTVYQERINDLVRIATGGTGRLPEGDLHPDLVNRIAGEASKTAANVLRMCMRAFDYLPPVDITFGDYLRALVTADFETVPGDERGLRAAMIESFRRRGIHPSVSSLSEEAVLWERREGDGLQLPFEPRRDALMVSALAFDRGPYTRLRDEAEQQERKREGEWAAQLGVFAARHAHELGLDPKQKVKVRGFHTVFRVSPSGQLVVELVAQFIQEDKSGQDDPDLGGVRVLGGTTVVADAAGRLRYVIAKPLNAERRDEQKRFVRLCDREDAMLAWGDDTWEPQRMKARTFARLHRGLRR